jgi:hypothetical protein
VREVHLVKNERRGSARIRNPQPHSRPADRNPHDLSQGIAGRRPRFDQFGVGIRRARPRADPGRRRARPEQGDSARAENKDDDANHGFHLRAEEDSGEIQTQGGVNVTAFPLPSNPETF